MVKSRNEPAEGPQLWNPGSWEALKISCRKGLPFLESTGLYDFGGIRGLPVDCAVK